MSEATDKTIAALGEMVTSRGPAADGILELRVGIDSISQAITALRDGGFGRFIDLTVVDDPKRPDRFDLQYTLYSMTDSVWLRVQARTEGDAPSITPLFAAADWYEREVFDMFGVRFRGHPNLTRILMPDDWVGHPLRRDVPLGGEPVEFSY